MNICVVIIHGIGRQDKTYADDFIRLISEEYYRRTGLRNLVFSPICWQEKIEPLESALFKKVSHLGWREFRDILISFAGDAICYQRGDDSTVYDSVNSLISDSLDILSSSNPGSPLCLVSHSMGTIISSNFLWDVYHSNFEASDGVRNMVNNLELFYTLGSPLSLWSVRYTDGGMPLVLPSIAKWYNIYSSNDIIGSPLKLINSRYSDLLNLFDVEIEAGSWLTKWTPLSHNEYWYDNRIINHLVSNLVTLNNYYEQVFIKEQL